MNNKPVVSIIVPVYNAERYLRRCIDSILAQSFRDFELLLIDDGSKDDSGKILDVYARHEPRIKVHHKKNGGVSSARNLGLKLAIGENIIFVDSDDYVTDSFVANFLNEENSSELVIQGFYIEREDRDCIEVRMPNAKFNCSWKVITFLEHTPNVHNGYLWHRMFKTAIVKQNNIYFKEDICFAEDGLFFLEYMKYVTNTVFVNQLGYHYMLSGNSLTKMGNTYSPDFYEKLFNEYKNALTSIEVNSTDFSQYNKLIDDYLFRLYEYWFVRKIFIQKNEGAKRIWLHYIKKVIMRNELQSRRYSISKRILIIGGLLENYKLAEFVLKIDTKYLSFTNRLHGLFRNK